MLNPLIPAKHRVKIGIGIFLSLLALILFALSRQEKVPFGSRTYSLEFEKASRRTGDPLFLHEGWDNPDGEQFARFDRFSIQPPGFEVTMEILANPLVAVREKMPSSIPDLMQTAKSTDPMMVWCAAEALGKKGADALVALPVLLDLLQKTNGAAYDAIHTICLATGRNAVPILVNALATPGKEYKRALISLLSDLMENAIIAKPALQRQLHSPYPEVRMEAAWALWRITKECDPGLREVLPQLRSPESQSRIKACLLLNQYGHCAVTGAGELRALLDKEMNYFVACQGVIALQAIGREDPLTLPFLVQLLETKRSSTNTADLNSNFMLRCRILEVLGSFGRGAMPTLLEAYASSNMQEMYSASKALLQVGPEAEEGLPLFISNLESGHPRKILTSCSILGSMGEKGRKAAPQLRVLVLAQDRDIRIAAAETLLRVGEGTPHEVQLLLDGLEKGPINESSALETLQIVADQFPQAKAFVEEKARVKKSRDEFFWKSFPQYSPKTPATNQSSS